MEGETGGYLLNNRAKSRIRERKRNGDENEREKEKCERNEIIIKAVKKTQSYLINIYSRSFLFIFDNFFGSIFNLLQYKKYFFILSFY